MAHKPYDAIPRRATIKVLIFSGMFWYLERIEASSLFFVIKLLLPWRYNTKQEEQLIDFY